MRERFRSLRRRPMARRPGEDDRFSVSPRFRPIGGWLVAILLVVGIAVAFRILGGNADGTRADPTPSGSTLSGDVAEITFGTAIDPETGEVAKEAVAQSFTAADTFAYSVPPGETVPDAVYVEVRRANGAEGTSLQEPVGAQPLPNPAVIAFTVTADPLLAKFGSGKFLMLIYAEPEDDPIAQGIFELVETDATPSASP